MGFLDNSGDIILDAVLTDAGRARLARGDCSFNIAKFALGDDEIDYSLYNKTHVSGSQYYDLEILQTPVLEAFTNNTSMMNSKLLSMVSDSEYYLPIIQLNETQGAAKHATAGTFVVAVNKDTVDYITNANSATPTSMGAGILNGHEPGVSVASNALRADQGINNADRPPVNSLPIELTEQAYFLQMDNRLGSVRRPGGTGQLAYSYLDDDQIASYYLELGQWQGLTHVSDFVENIAANLGAAASPIAGERGTKVQFRIKSSLELESSQNLFERIGTQVASGQDITTDTGGQSLTQYWYIDSTIRLTGVFTGYRIDIPVRYVRKY
jgi:hypothetical protein